MVILVEYTVLQTVDSTLVLMATTDGKMNGNHTNNSETNSTIGSTKDCEGGHSKEYLLEQANKAYLSLVSKKKKKKQQQKTSRIFILKRAPISPAKEPW